MKKSFTKKMFSKSVAAAAAGVVAGFAIVPSAHAVVRFNEVMVDAPGSNPTQDFFELKSTTPGESVAGLTVLLVEGDSGTPNGRGNIDGVLPLSGAPSTVTGTNGLFLRHSFGAGPSPAIDPATTVWNSGYGHENAAITWILVSGFTGAVNTDIDANDDGIVDNTPWTSVLDSIGMADGDVDADKTFGAVLGGADFNAPVQGSTPNVVLRDTTGVMHAAQVTGAVGGPYTVNRSDTLALGYVLSPGGANNANTLPSHAFIGTSNSNWTTGTNWSGGVAPAVAGDIAIMDGGSGQTVNLNSNVTVGSLVFNGGSETVAAGGGTLTLDTVTGNPSILVSYGNVKVNPPIVMNKDTTFSAGRAQTLDLSATTVTGSSNITLGGGGTIIVNGYAGLGSGTQINYRGGILKTTASLGTITRAIDIGNTGGGLDTNGFDTTIPVAITGVSTGTNAWVKAGNGVLTLTGANTFDSGLSITGGTIRVQNNNALGSSIGGTTIGGLGNESLELDGANSPGGSLTINESFSITGKTGAGAGNLTPHINNLTGTNTINGDIAMIANGTWYNLQSTSGKLTINGNITNPTNATARIVQIRGAGDGEITGGLFTVAPGTGALTLDKHDAGTWSIGVTAHTGPTIVEGGKLILKSNLTTSSSVSVTGGTLQLASDGSHNRAIKTGTVAATGGKIDLVDNKLITTSAVGTASGGIYTGVTGLLQAGYNGGGWSGATGIVSSLSNATANNDYTTLAVGRAADIRGIALTATDTWGGQTVTGSNTLVMYTYGGDANLDGIVDILDYGQIDGAINANLASPGYFNGDFNYDGIVDILDYGVIDGTINTQGAAFPTGDGTLSAVSVPEPGALGAVVIVGLVSQRRRRRHGGVI